MYRFKLFSEWREIEIIGDSLSDALQRKGTLQCPDKFMEGKKIDPGKVLTIERVIGIEKHDKSHVTRGNRPIMTAIVEFTNGEIMDVDASVDEITLSEDNRNFATSPKERKLEIVRSIDPLGRGRRAYELLFKGISVGYHIPDDDCLQNALKDADRAIDKCNLT